MSDASGQWVFGYGSLMTDHVGRGAVPSELPGYRRVWGVAADNRRTIPGYKVYLDRADGSRPEVFVSFLDLEPDEHGTVHGFARPVDAAQLAALDRRERNYERVDVSEAVRGPKGRVWVYMGSAQGRARLDEGVKRGTAVISHDYLEKVRTGLRTLPHRDLLPDGLPVRDLDRVDLPA